MKGSEVLLIFLGESIWLLFLTCCLECHKFILFCLFKSVLTAWQTNLHLRSRICEDNWVRVPGLIFIDLLFFGKGGKVYITQTICPTFFAVCRFRCIVADICYAIVLILPLASSRNEFLFIIVQLNTGIHYSWVHAKHRYFHIYVKTIILLAKCKHWKCIKCLQLNRVIQTVGGSDVIVVSRSNTSADLASSESVSSNVGQAHLCTSVEPVTPVISAVSN